jgi:hypothetical protein
MTKEVPVLLDELRNWFFIHHAEMRAGGLECRLGEPPDDGRDKSALWIDIDSATRVGQLILWSSGEAELAIAKVGSNEPVIHEHRKIASKLELDDALGSFLARVSDSAET